MDRGDSSRLAFAAFPEYFSPIPNLCSNLVPFFSLPYDYKSAANQLTWIIFVMQNSKRTNDSVFGEKRLPPLIFLPPSFYDSIYPRERGNVSLESITISGKKEEEEERRESKLTAAKTLFRSIEKVSFKLDRSWLLDRTLRLSSSSSTLPIFHRIQPSISRVRAYIAWNVVPS